MNINQAFNKLMIEYDSAYNKVWSENKFKHPLADFIRHDIPNILETYLDSTIYTVKGACGVGRWTPTPWIAVFDTRITKRARDGVYIVYLLNKNNKELFLTLIQATYEKSDAELTYYRDLVRKTIVHNDLEIKIDSGDKNYDTACIYAKKYTTSSLPESSVLENDLREFVGIYKEYYDAFYAKSRAFFPSSEEYNPGFSKEDWFKILNDPTIIGPVWGNALAMFYTEKDGATCSQLGKKFNRNATSISGNCTQLAKRIHTETDCPLYVNQDGKDMYWPIMFVGRHADTNDEGSFVWKLRDELYEALSEFDILRFLNSEGGDEIMTIKSSVDHIKNYIAAKGFTYPDGLVENFYLSLKSKPFVILAGTSGTGKTRLVKLFAEAIGATNANGRFRLVSVRPDWSDSSDLFGHVDLNGKFIPGAIIDFVKQAELDTAHPYILCLDEMNLARVEYYLSDVLSIIETRDFQNGEIVSDPLIDSKYFGSDVAAAGKYGTIRLPENLYIVGTVNMDETTFPFSRKVLDRANTIEFSYVDLVPDFESIPQAVAPLALTNDFLKTEHLLLNECDEDSVGEICVELKKINDILEKASAHIGYRVRDEVVFYMINNKKNGLLNADAAFDNEIMQKILPRIQGSSASVKNMLCELFKVCAADYDGYQTSDNVSDKMLAVLKKETCKYRKSAEKIAFMVRRFEEDGFTSYWL